MYFPYLRGKQNELIALRELLEIGRISNRVIPIIEPIKSTTTLVSTVHMFNEKKRKIAFICNPSVGDFTKDINKLIKEKSSIATNLIEEIKDENFIKSYIINKDVLPDIINKHDKYNYLIINKNKDCMDSFFRIYGDGLPRFSLIPNVKAFKSSISDSKVLLQDHFNKLDRNIDYMNNDDEFFSSDHLEYYDEGFVGFSDYSVIGQEFKASGFAAFAVVIHIVYFDIKNELRVKHFVSDSNNDTNDPAKKFGEALKKLVEWCKDHDIYVTEGLRQLYKCYDMGYYPGLGIIKKLSIMHHIELMSIFLDEKN